MAPNGYNLYPAQYYPSPVPQYAPRVTTQASTPVIRTQPKSLGTLCTSTSRKTLQHCNMRDCSFWVSLLLWSLSPPVLSPALHWQQGQSLLPAFHSVAGQNRGTSLTLFGRERPSSSLDFWCSTTVCLPSSASLWGHGFSFLPL